MATSSAFLHISLRIVLIFNSQDILAEDPDTHGAMFVPIILGSDKTTVSVATGHNQYYPLYASIGNVRNHVRRAHRNAVSLVGFLAIPHSEYLSFYFPDSVLNASLFLADKQHEDSNEFLKFRRQLFHESLAHILRSLRPWMSKPRITRCGDGHYRRVIYGLGPYIADYPEQTLLACVVSGWCPK
jgi:Plavaka transposase